MNGPYPYISHDHPDYKYTSNGMSSDFSAAYEDACKEYQNRTTVCFWRAWKDLR